AKHTSPRHPFVIPSSRPHRHLHSFPTRRSSDLPPRRWPRAGSARQRRNRRTADWKPAALPPAFAAHCEPCRDTPASSRHAPAQRSEEHTSELQSQSNLVCRLLLEKKKKN